GNDMLHGMRLAKYSPVPVTMVLTIHSFGPTRKMKAKRMKASHRFSTESLRIPLSIPDTTLMSAITVMTMMMIDCDHELLGMPNTSDRPLLICRVPSPSDVANPKI